LNSSSSEKSISPLREKEPSDGPTDRGLNSFTSELNLSTFLDTFLGQVGLRGAQVQLKLS